ncbi:MAG: SufE family protein [Bacteroidales bacterium]|jgi:cysteine desulfuration protein SufE|nr:SufE family protein [Bacteroidales bacterium]MBQ5891868.1 SufE family protein [Bacteroidales bacterium]MEE0267005.1 SufE family protein [Bacteroidales bacterium]MEE0882893.1 SufE family protein [Bacteroidales bacterium]MEE1021409.1 SufE family protein [Bacteroidales bacterium]
MSIEEIEQEIIEEFSNFEDWMDKYSYIIEIGNTCPIIEEKEKTENNLIKGCQSRVWVSAKLDERGLMQITADSDAVITKGIITLLLRVFNNQKPEDVYSAELKFIDEIGLKSHLSPTRSNGLLSMIKQIKLYALAFSVKQNQ